MRRMFLNGTAMSGGADHHVISGATFLGPRQTAPIYRFIAVRDAFPGLLRVSEGGASIVGELYEMTEDMLLRELLPAEPAELELATAVLDDGDVVDAMNLRPERVAEGDKTVDITHHGGWRAYQAQI